MERGMHFVKALESIPRLGSVRHASMVIRFAHPFGAALRALLRCATFLQRAQVIY